MRKTKELLRLRFELGLGQRQIARSCGMDLGTVHDYLERAAAAGIGWPLPEGWSEEELEAKLFGNLFSLSFRELAGTVIRCF
jgi:Sigma-70, region 4